MPRTESAINRFLELGDRTPLTMGRSRLVFEHPDDPSLIVKVVRPDVVDDRFGSGTTWYKRRRRYGRFLSYVRELQEYIAVYAAQDHSPPFLQKVIGLAETDLGLGLITEAVQDAEGNLAPNLGALIAAGQFDSAARARLNLFLEQILDCDVVISDMNVGNLVYAFTQERGSFFVLIDGLGNSNPLPFKSINRKINRRSKLKHFERLYDRIEIRLNNAGHPMPSLPEEEA